MNELIKKAAARYLQSNYSVIPISLSGKCPVVDWAEFYDRRMSIEEWNYERVNIGVVTGVLSGIVVVDCDSEESYVGWLKHRQPTPMRVKSRRGMHFWYRHPGTYVASGSHFEAEEGFKYDIKGDKSYVLAPPSISRGHQYHVCNCRGNITAKLIDNDKLPEFDVNWRPVTKRVAREWSDKAIRDIRAYIRSITAIAGQGGDKATFNVALKLAQSCDSEMEAMALMAEWNVTNARPQWSIEELQRKLEIAYESMHVGG
jgi:hypothetical protein